MWDYGPLGVELRNNVKQAWWRDYVYGRTDIVGLDAGILASPESGEASGHLQNFTDPLVECRNCHNRFRADQIDLAKNCPVCGLKDWTDIRQFNTMFKTFVGPVEGDASVAYLRPETCQAIFTNFRLVQQAMRRKLPFGIAQIGKAFRNEITTGNFIFRLRELEQMELEYFVRPGEDVALPSRNGSKPALTGLKYGVRREMLDFYEHPDEDRAFYSKRTVDIMYDFPFGKSELQGVANRTDYDPTQHTRASGEELDYFEEETKEHVVPYVIEPSIGVDRAMLVFLLEAYDEEPDKEGLRTVMRFHPRLAPSKSPSSSSGATKPSSSCPSASTAPCAVKCSSSTTKPPPSGALPAPGRDRHPWCVTVDSQSLQDGTVTVRDRDSMAW